MIHLIITIEKLPKESMVNYMLTKHFLLLIILFTNSFVAGLEKQSKNLKIGTDIISTETPQSSTPLAKIITQSKEDAECEKLGKLLSRLPKQVGFYIIDLAVNKLHKVTIFEKVGIRRRYRLNWIPIETRFDLASQLTISQSTIIEFTYFNESSGEKRKQKITAHDSVTKSVVEQFYRELSTKKTP